jgi:hypothetical protein
MSKYTPQPSPYKAMGLCAWDATGIRKPKAPEKTKLPSMKQISKAKLKGLHSPKFNPGSNYAKEKRDSY